jgi:hypothetical protein
MRRLLFQAGLALCGLIVPAFARADVWTPSFQIPVIAQNTDQTLVIFAPTSGWGISVPPGCTITGQFYVQATNGTYPSYNSLAPLLIAAYLFAKPVSLDLVACTGWGVPVVGGIQLNP